MQPEGAVRQFLSSVLPSEADQRSRVGEAKAASGDLEGAAAMFRDALGLSWVKYLQGLRIHRALALLAHPGQTIALVGQGLLRTMQALAGHAKIDLRGARYVGYAEWLSAELKPTTPT